MRYLVVSDMHANWDAFQAVLARVRRKRFDRILVLGDLVGYGASPNQVVEAVRGLSRPSLVIRGNHDKVVARIDSGFQFNEVALAAARWTTERLTPANLRYVEELPIGPREVEEDVAVCHGSPLDEDAYVFSDFDAHRIFSAYPARVVFFGHTHVTSMFSLAASEGGRVRVKLLRGSGEATLDPETRYLINPGSIGQPRDRDPRASYMTFDSESGRLHWYRLSYPIERAQGRIRSAGLPDLLAERLAVGM